MASIIRRTYKVTLPDGTVETRECDHWTIQYRDAAGRIKRVKGYADKGATKQLAAKLERNLARGEQGLIDPHREQKARPLSEHLTDWVTDRTSAGRSADYLDNCKKRITILADACGWKCLTDIDPNSFLRWRDKAKKTPRNGTVKGQQTVAATTLNQYLDSANAFLNWCVKPGNRIPANPLRDVDKVSGEKVRQRRALSDEQVSALLAVTPESRLLVYRLALATGLRRGELEDLVWGDVRLTAIPFAIQLRAEATKAKRADRVYIPASLAEDLRKEKPKNAADTAPVFPEVPPLEDWKADLKAAEIPYRDEMGRQVDFHAGTRKTLCTRLHRNNVPLVTAMKVMRHTDTRLTAVDYTDDSQLGTESVILPEPVIKAPAKSASAGA
jgi:integrase